MNRKAVSMVILFLVVVTIVLCVLSLYYMLIEERKIDKTFQNSDFIDKVYFKKMQLDYALQSIFDVAVLGFKFSDGKNVFIGRFKEELINYQLDDGGYVIEGLEVVEGQLVEENIELSEKKLVLNLNLSVENQEVGLDYRFVSVDYSYESNLQKVFK